MVSKIPQKSTRSFALSAYSDYLWAKQRVEERTRIADLVSLQVKIRALQRCAHGCKSCISRPISFLCLAPCCTVLCSRWCQYHPPIYWTVATAPRYRRLNRMLYVDFGENPFHEVRLIEERPSPCCVTLCLLRTILLRKLIS